MKLKLYDQETKELTEHEFATLEDLLVLTKKYKEITVIHQTADDSLGPPLAGDEFVLFKYDSNSPLENQSGYKHCVKCGDPIDIWTIETCQICEAEFCSDCFETHSCGEEET